MKALQLGSLSFVLVVLGAGCSTTPPPYSGPTAEPVDGPSADGPSAEPPAPRRGRSTYLGSTAEAAGDPDSTESVEQAQLVAPFFPVGEGSIRLAGWSGGEATLDWSEDSDPDVMLDAWVEMGKLLSDSFEVGVQMDLIFDIGDQGTFSGILDPGLYGRLYFGALDGGFTPWIRGDLAISNLIEWGDYDYGQDTELDLEMSLGVTTFITDGVALEMGVPILVIEEDIYGDTDSYSPIFDGSDHVLTLEFGLAFFW